MLNLDRLQSRQAKDALERAEKTASVRLQEAYCWLLVPSQQGTEPWAWEAIRLGGGDGFPVRASRKLQGSGQLIGRWSPALLKMELDQWLWNESRHLSTKQLWDYLCTYGYLSRLVDESVLTAAVAEGVRSRDYFGYAASVGGQGRYEGLTFGAAIPESAIHIDAVSIVVKPDVAIRQLEEDAERERERERERARQTGAGSGVIAELPITERWTTPPTPPPPTLSQPAPLTRFHGAVELDATRVGSEAGRVVEEVIQHLTTLANSRVTVHLEIEAEIPDGVPDDIVRIVLENSRTLKFTNRAFDPE